MKEKAKADGQSVDVADLGRVVQNELKKAATDPRFFIYSGLDTGNIRVKLKTHVC